MPDVAPPGRGVLFWRARAEQETSQAVVRNRLGGEVRRMLLGYRPRGTGTATLHRDGPQPLGRGACPVRRGAGQTRHVSRVSAAYRLLMRSLQQSRAQAGARRTLTTSGEAGRAVQAETLERMVDWIGDKLTVDHWSLPDIQGVLVYS
jgi:hypothetical protein